MDAPVDTPLKNATVKFIIKISPQASEYHVGDTVDVSVCLKNTGDKQISVYRPPESQMPPQMFSVSAYIKEQAGDSSSKLACPSSSWSTYGDSHPSDFITLQPGQSTKPVKREITFLLSGGTEIQTSYENGEEGPSYLKAQTSEEVVTKIPDLFQGTISDEIQVKVSDRMPPEMKARYDAARREIDDAAAPAKDRLAALASVAAEKHQFAARFVVDIWRSTTDPAIKMEALRQWLNLLQLGTAYEALPDAIKLLADENTPVDVRTSIANAIDRGQYFLEPSTLETFHKALAQAIASGDPTLMATARRVLARYTYNASK